MYIFFYKCFKKKHPRLFKVRNIQRNKLVQIECGYRPTRKETACCVVLGNQGESAVHRNAASEWFIREQLSVLWADLCLLM